MPTPHSPARAHARGYGEPCASPSYHAPASANVFSKHACSANRHDISRCACAHQSPTPQRKKAQRSTQETQTQLCGGPHPTKCHTQLWSVPQYRAQQKNLRRSPGTTLLTLFTPCQRGINQTTIVFLLPHPNYEFPKKVNDDQNLW